MSYRNQYSGSPWQQGGPPFGVGGYNQNYGGYNDQYDVSHQMMNAVYNRNQGDYGGGGGSGMYGGSGMSQMRNMGYGGPSPSRHYMNDRMSGRQMGRGQMQRKRLPRSPASGPRSKRANIESDRRMTKPRRHRDSRGGSKSHHDHNEGEEDDVDYDMFECWKSSDEDGDSKEEKASKENGEQELADTENTDMDSKTDDSKAKKPLICYVCKVSCSTKERLTKHRNSKSHTAKIDELLAIRREKKDTGKNEKKEKEQPEQEKKKSYRKSGNWCRLCESAFTGNFLAHCRTKEHRNNRDKKYPKCRPCRLGFSSSEEYRDHCKSKEHKQRSAEFHYLKNLASGSDEDEAAIQPVKVEDDKSEEKEEIPTVKSDVKEEDESAATSEDKEKTEEGKTKEKNDETKEKDEKKELKKSKPKEPKCIGQSFVVSVQGYYCKLCHKFFKDVTVAKSKHCRSIMHTDAFKKAMEEATEQEEERQKLAEELNKQVKEAADAEELAAEIAEIERSAKEAAKKEFAAKKAGASKDVEMKDVSDKASKDVAVSKEIKDESANKDGMENGVKEDLNEGMNDSEEAKDSAKDSEANKEEPVDEEQG